MTGARERRCTLRASATRRHAHWHVRINVCRMSLVHCVRTAGATYAVTCTCTRRYAASRNGRNAHLHSACTHCSMYTHTRSGCGMLGTSAQLAAAVCVRDWPYSGALAPRTPPRALPGAALTRAVQVRRVQIYCDCRARRWRRCEVVSCCLRGPVGRLLAAPKTSWPCTSQPCTC